MLVLEESEAGVVIATANYAFYRAAGYSHSAIIGRPLRLLIAPDADPSVYSRVTEAISERRQLRTELPCCGSDGKRFWLGIHLMPVKRAEPICSIVLARDITDSRHERQQQNAIQSLLAKVFLCVPVPVAIISDDGFIQMSNPALDTLLGHSAGTLPGKRATDFVAPECRPAVLEARARQIKDGLDYTLVIRVLRSDGTEHPVKLTSVTVHREDLKRFRIITLLDCAESTPTVSVHVAGKIRLIGLQDVRDSLGPRWPEVASRALATAEHVVRQSCGRGDSYSRTTEDDFLICFSPGLSEEEAAFRAAMIAKEIRVRLIGEGQSDRASHVTAITAAIELPHDPSRHQDKLNQLLSERLNTQLSSIEAKARETLRMAVATATCELEPIWSRHGAEPTAYYGQLSRELDHRVQAAYCTLSVADRADFDYDRLVLGVAASGAVAQLAAGHPSTIFVTVWFEVFLDRRCLDRYLATCRTLDQRLREHLMLVIAGIPKGCPLSRLLDCINRLRPMCRGVALQFETLNPPPFDLTALASPIVCVPVNDVSLEDPKQRALLTKLVRSVHACNSHILIRQTGARDQTQQLRQLGVNLISRAIAPAHS